jgi:proline iminopeptidase
VWQLGPTPGRAQQTPPIEREGRVETSDGLTLSYRVVGESPDTVVVVHGGPGAGMGSILPHLAPLADSLTVIFFDQRGGGRSSLPADLTLLAPEGFGADLEAVRRFFALERMQVVAHSFGAIVVAHYLRDHPDRIERLVLLGATGPKRADAAVVARAAADTAAAADPGRAEVLQRLLSGTADDPAAACRAYESLGDPTGEGPWRGTACDMPPAAIAYYFAHTAQLGPAAYGDWDYTRSLAAVPALVLVVHGEMDDAYAPLDRAWARAFSRARLWTISGAGRAAIAERPAVVWAGILRFFRGHWPSDARRVDR